MARLINLAERVGPEILARFRAGEFAGGPGVEFASEALEETAAGVPLGELAAGSTAAIAVGYGIGKLAAYFSGRKRGKEEPFQAYTLGPSTEMERPSKKQKRNGGSTPSMPPLAAGTVQQITRTGRSFRGRSGRLKGKSLQLFQNYIQRFQRVYPFGPNLTAFPDTGLATHASNPGWNFIAGTTNAVNTGRLMLNHVNGVDFGSVEPNIGYLLPLYLVDITCVNNSNPSLTAPFVCKRLGVNSAGDYVWNPVVTQSQGHDNFDYSWLFEKAHTFSGGMLHTEDKGILKWSDIKLQFYSATSDCTNVHVDFVQFLDGKYQMDFHPDGERFADMTPDDKDDVQMCYTNLLKKLIYNPIDTQMGAVKKGVRFMKSDSFCLEGNANNADSIIGVSARAPCTIRKYFKRWNRLCNFNWVAPVPGVNLVPGVGGVASGLETPQYQVSLDTNSKRNYLHPNARIFMMIRGEDFDPQVGSTSLGANNVLTSRTNVCFDMIVRTGWKFEE